MQMMLWTRIFPLLLLKETMAAISGKNPICEALAPSELKDLRVADDCVLEQVLDNFVQKYVDVGKSANNTGHQGTAAALKRLLKTTAPSSEPIKIKVEKVEVLMASAWQHDFYLFGLMNLAWKDSRLNWERKAKPKEEKFVIRSEEQMKIWVPHIADYQNHILNHDYKEGRETVVQKSGQVVHHLMFGIQENCPRDMKAFPNDVHHCCADFQAKKNSHLIKFDIKGVKYDPHLKHRTEAEWVVTLGKITTIEDGRVLELCVSLERRSNVFTMLVICPLVASAILAIVIPLFTTWQIQILSKFTSLILQFICLVFISNIRDLRISYTVPKFVRLYDFVIWMTVVSVTVTTVLWAWSRREKHAMPPPRRLSLLATCINPLFCASAAPPPADSATPDDTDDLSFAYQQQRNQQSEWVAAFLAINNLSLILFTVIYILGIVILAA